MVNSKEIQRRQRVTREVETLLILLTVATLEHKNAVNRNCKHSTVLRKMEKRDNIEFEYQDLKRSL